MGRGRKECLAVDGRIIGVLFYSKSLGCAYKIIKVHLLLLLKHSIIETLLAVEAAGEGKGDQGEQGRRKEGTAEVKEWD